MPYSASESPSSENTSAPATTTTYDALGRVLASQTPTVVRFTYTYTNNDVLQKLSGSQTFQKQFEYDGLGRLTSVCEISSTLDGRGCLRAEYRKTGYWTQYTYDALGTYSPSHRTRKPRAVAGRTFVYLRLAGPYVNQSNPKREIMARMVW